MMLTDIHGVIAGPGADQGDERRAFDAALTKLRASPSFLRMADGAYVYWEMEWQIWQAARALSAAQPVAPDGYALISVDALRAWGKLDEVTAACKYPIAAPQPSQGIDYHAPAQSGGQGNG